MKRTIRRVLVVVTTETWTVTTTPAGDGSVPSMPDGDAVEANGAADGASSTDPDVASDSAAHHAGRLALALAVSLAALGVVWIASTSAPASQAAPANSLCVSPPGGGCPYSKIQDAINAAAPDDTILILPGTYSENLTINKNLTLIGQVQLPAFDAGQTIIDGGKKGRVIEVRSAMALTLTNVTIQNGLLGNTSTNQGRGGGISVDTNARLQLSNSIIQANTAYDGGGLIAEANSLVSISDSAFFTNTATFGGALNNGGTVAIQRAWFQQNSAAEGGAVYNYAAPSYFSAQKTVFDFNRADASGSTANWGGAINNLGTLILTESSLIGNSSFGYGAGLANRWSAKAAVVNSTVAQNLSNRFGGGIYAADQSTLSVGWTTIAYNSSNLDDTFFIGGGIYSADSALITATGTLLAKNTFGPAANQIPNDCAATLQSNGYNLVQDASGCTINSDNATNLKGVDPQLSPKLDDTFSPFVVVIPLQPGSPAIDAGGTLCPPTDQRSTQRPVNLRCDIGAFEAAYRFLPLAVH